MVHVKNKTKEFKELADHSRVNTSNIMDTIMFETE